MQYDFILNMLGKLCIVIALILAGLFLYKKKLAWVSSNKSIELLSSLILSQHQRIALIKINQTELLIGITANQINVLHSYQPNTPAAHSNHTAAFDQISLKEASLK